MKRDKEEIKRRTELQKKKGQIEEQPKIHM